MRRLLRKFTFLLLLLPVLAPKITLAQPNADFSGTPLSGCSPLVVLFSDLSTGNPTSWLWDLGNGNTSTFQNPSALYIVPGTYTVTLTVTDGGGLTDTQTRTSYITVFQDPLANFGTVGSQSGCAPLTVDFQDLSVPGSAAITSWQWNFGDGTNSTAQNPSHTYNLPGSYTLTLIVTDANGCDHTFQVANYVNVSDPVIAGFSAAPTGSCNQPLTVNFNNTTTGGSGGLTYQWDFGDGNSSTAQNPSNTYTANGTYTVTLIATDPNGCSDTLTRAGFINIVPIVAGFNVANTSGCAGFTTNFTNTSTGGANTFDWDFGDGNGSTSANPNHTYAASGAYNVTFIASFGGCADTITQTVNVTVLPAPTAGIGGAPTVSCDTPLTVPFVNTSSGGTAPLSYLWNFGDGNTSTATNPSHTYTNFGSYNVSLTVTDANGCTDQVTLNNFVLIQPPVVDFDATPLTGCVPLTVPFNDLTTLPPGYIIIGWAWDFGDGNTSGIQNPSNTYTATGIYTVTLTVTILDPGTGTTCTATLVRPNYIAVGDVPIADFFASPLAGCINDTIQFTDQSINAGAWAWDFGDGGTSNLQNPPYVYTDTGTFTVTLTVTNLGCVDDTIIVDYIRIDAPIADFGINPVVSCGLPANVAFTDLSIAIPVNTLWDWTFGDGNTSSLQNPSNTYLAAGNYPVRLIVTDTVTGCIDSLTQPLDVSDPQAGFTRSPDSICFGFSVAFVDTSTGATGWQWTFGDGGTSNQQNPTYTYNTPGSYEPRLVISDGFGCTDTAFGDTVHVFGPTVDFSAVPQGACRFDPITFTDLSTSQTAITSRLWDFDDGFTSTLNPVVHVYTVTGSRDITLTVTDALGCVATRTRNNFVNVSDPVVNFTISDTLGCTGLAINFNSTIGSARGPLNYFWDFGDGNTSNVADPTYTYTTEGNFDVKLVVVDANGCSDSLTIIGAVEVSNDIIGFTAAPTTASCPPLEVFFVDTSGYDIVAWNWDFGDGNSSNLQSPSNIYATSGNFDVTLEVVRSTGCRDTLFVPALVNLDGPNGTFVESPDSGCTPHQVTFTATAISTVQYTWDFGDGTVLSTPNAVTNYSYTRAGTFYPLLILDDGLGCTFGVPFTDSIEVDTIPIVDFSADRQVLCGPGDVQFTDLSIHPRPIIAWSWDFGDGNTSNLQNPLHPYAAPGFYTVELTVTAADFNCTNTETRVAYIYVHDVPTAAFTQDTAVGCNPFDVQFTDASVQNAGIGPINDWQWDFGDGATATTQNTAHTYPIVGNYVVTLIITDSVGCMDTATGAVQVNPGPTAAFTAVDSNVCPAETVQLNAATGMGIASWDWTLGNGNTATGDTVTHVYNAVGDFTVGLIVTDTLGCMDTLIKTDYIQIHPPVANFAGDSLAGCPIHNVVFSDSTVFDTTGFSWDWNFGDGNTGTGPMVSHPYPNPGQYTVTLMVEDVLGCRDTLVRNNYIEVYTPPTSAFAIIDTLACFPFTIELQDNSTAGTAALTNWDWDFGDGNTSVLQNPIHPFATPGTYTITQIITDANVCMDTSSFVFVAPPYPVADFTADDSIGCNPFTVTFTAHSQPNISGWRWDFGDATPITVDTDTTITHTYLNPGDFTVTLIVTDTVGCEDTLTKINYIRIHPPVAEFTISDSSGCPPHFVIFQDSSVFDTNAVNYFWDFGDGSTAMGDSVSHIYPLPGSYTVELIVEDTVGCRDTLVKPNIITVWQPPVSNFGITDTIGCFPFTVQFTDSSTSSYPLTNWDYDFGDGTSDTLQNPAHGFAPNANYTITQIITDENGCMDTSSVPFTAPVDPIAAFISADSLACFPDSVRFTDLSTAAVSWVWDFGDGDTSTLQNPVHVYDSIGKYRVSLAVTDQFGCTDTAIAVKLVQLFDPQADFGVDTTGGCLPLTITFTDSSIVDTTIIDWQWDFGDGQTGTGNPVQNTYTGFGDFSVQLIITNAIGCVDTVFYPDLIGIYPPPSPQLYLATVLDDTRDSISFSPYIGDDFDHYTVYRESTPGSGIWNPIDSVFVLEDTFYVDAGVNTRATGHCYKVIAVNTCAERSLLDSVPAHCTMENTATPGLDLVDLSWTPYVGWSVLEYEVYRVAGYDTTTDIFMGTVPGTVTTFTDSAAICYQINQYRIRAIEDGGLGRTSFSDTAAAEPIHIAPTTPMDMLFVTVEENEYLEFEWAAITTPDPMFVFLEKSTDGQNWSQLATFPPGINGDIDRSVDVHAQSYWYRVNVLDSCGDVTPWSNVARSIHLQIDNALGVISLSWNPYQDWAGGVDYYEIELYDETLQQWFLLSTVPGNTTEFVDDISTLDQGELCYRIRAHESVGNGSISLSNEVCIIPDIWIPNTVTPNNDGSNDFLVIPALQYYSDNEIVIFNRWGNIVYEKVGYQNEWDGRNHKSGDKVPDGTYFYILKINSTGESYQGYVMVFR